MLEKTEEKTVKSELRPYLKFTYFDVDGTGVEQVKYQYALYENDEFVRALPFEEIPEGEYLEYVLEQDYAQLESLGNARFQAEIAAEQKTELDKTLDMFRESRTKK